MRENSRSAGLFDQQGNQSDSKADPTRLHRLLPPNRRPKMAGTDALEKASNSFA